MAKQKQEEQAEEKKPKEKYVVGEVATQTEQVIIDNETNTTYTVLTALAKVMNDVEKLKAGLI